MKNYNDILWNAFATVDGVTKLVATTRPGGTREDCEKDLAWRRNAVASMSDPAVGPWLRAEAEIYRCQCYHDRHDMPQIPAGSLVVASLGLGVKYVEVL
ncbi:MAG: hypothetical protein ABL901_19995 [Hyphomicrobiaceae bacterium]